MKVYEGPLEEGWYIYSSCGCGDESAIRIQYLESSNDCYEFSLSPEDALKLAIVLITVAKNYQNGFETEIV